MKNQKIRLFILFTIAIALSLALNSCRSVKKDKSSLTESAKNEEVKTETETEKEESNVQKTEEIKINSQTGTVTKKTTKRPADNTKPATVIDKHGNKTTLENAVLEEEETTTNNITTADQKTALDIKYKKEKERIMAQRKKEDLKIKQEQLALQKTGFNFWQLLWLIIPAGILVIYKFKDKIWWI
jgi:hypothetical protein